MINVTDREIKASYKLQYKAEADLQDWMKFVSKRTTNQIDGEKYAQMEPGAGMREKGMPNQYTTRVQSGFPLPNRAFEIERVLTRDDYEANKVSKFTDAINEMAQLTAIHPAEMVETLLIAGITTADPFDTSVYFYDDGHSRQGSLAVQSNKFAGTTTADYTTLAALDVTDTEAPTDTEWANILFALASKMQLMTNSAGQRIMTNQRSFTVGVGATLYFSLIRFLSKEVVGYGATNEVKSSGYSFTPMLMPNQDATEDAGIHFLANGRTPIIWQVYSDPSKVITTGPGTIPFDYDGLYKMKAESRYNCGFEHYQFACYGVLK